MAALSGCRPVDTAEPGTWLTRQAVLAPDA
jgi:hypothetical protein